MKIHSLRGCTSRVALGMGLILLTISIPVSAAGPGWYNNLDQAVQVARQQGRPIFVDFSTSWCSVCKNMDRTTLADPAVVGRLENFVKVKVDGDAFPQLCQAYGVDAYPTFVHLDSNGRMLDKRVGGMRVQEMAGALDKTLRTVSTSMAIMQANQQAEAKRKAVEQVSLKHSKPDIASADMNISRPGGVADNERQMSRQSVPDAAAERAGAVESRSSDRTSQNGSLYNMTASNPLQGNASAVYATDAANSARRSRFGNDSAGGLKQLAEATAKPEDAKNLSTESRSSNRAPEGDDAPAEKTEDADSSRKVETSQPYLSEKEPKAKSGPAQTTIIPQTGEVSQPSPVIESRLAGLSTESLPRPLLSRSASGATQTMNPAEGSATVQTVANERPSPIRMQRNDAGDASPAIPAKSVEIASASPSRSTAAQASRSEEQKKPETTKKVDSGESAKPEEKTSEGATRSDIIRWMNDADSKLIEAHKTQSTQKKREARAMYNKVVEKDPKNKFGKSDMAYVKMVSLIVDKDSDLLRRQAYTKIKDFEARFPDSSHKDYYTLIRAMLATDLGETNEAHKLLASFPDRFPDSKYLKVAHDTYKALPPVKSESSSKKNKTSASSKSKSSGRDS